MAEVLPQPLTPNHPVKIEVVVHGAQDQEPERIVILDETTVLEVDE